MNQEQVKKKLLQLDREVEHFEVVFSGKESKKVDGLYKTDSREIIIHNHNHKDDNSLMYTAIHEFAHHIQFTRSPVPISSRCHTNKFWSIFHNLLFRAEEKGIFVNIFSRDQRFIALTNKIKDKFLIKNGHLMKEFGRLLQEASKLCLENHVSFDDYVDRELGLHRTTAKTIMRVSASNVNPEIGFENMKTVASIRNDDNRKLAEEAFMEGKSPDMVRAEFTSRKKPDDALEYLIGEKNRIEKSIDKLTVMLARIERKIEDMRYQK
ncbi:MAG: hypothetical protein MUC95_09525 [Spirochaetes bacterium]|nr:hypothetical protein [Spirochaetota bacterium]